MADENASVIPERDNAGIAVVIVINMLEHRPPQILKLLPSLLPHLAQIERLEAGKAPAVIQRQLRKARMAIARPPCPAESDLIGPVRQITGTAGRMEFQLFRLRHIPGRQEIAHLVRWAPIPQSNFK